MLKVLENILKGIIAVVIIVTVMSLVVSSKNKVDIEGILDIGEELVKEFQGEEGVYEGVGVELKEDIKEIRRGLQELDKKELNVTEYREKLGELYGEEENQGIMDAGVYGEEYYPSIELGDTEGFEEVSYDSRLYEKEGDKYIKLIDLEYEEGVAYVEYEGVDLGIKESEMPKTLKHMKGDMSYIFKLEGYNIREDKKEVEVDYISINGETRLSVIFDINKKGKAEGVEIQLKR